MRILLTGAGGFVGQGISKLLLKHGLRFVPFTGDLCHMDTFNRGSFDIVIHTAALVSHSKDWSGSDLVDVNVIGTQNIYRQYPDAKIIFISTTDVSRTMLTEYAATKLAAEEIIKQKKDNLIIRLPSVFGPNMVQDKLIPRLIRHYFLRCPCQISNDNINEYLYIDKVAEGIVNNMNCTGLTTLFGVKISNSRLDIIIQSIYLRQPLIGLKPDELEIYKQLEECCRPDALILAGGKCS
jgi:nucleoside-diphosphate-sugar epimerase